MLSVYLAREFSLDLVEEMARRRAPKTATTLAPELRRAIGVGNATGLGMAPFIVGHPQLVHRWNRVRETAIARVKAVEEATYDKRARFAQLLARAVRHAHDWSTGDPSSRRRSRRCAASWRRCTPRCTRPGRPAGCPTGTPGAGCATTARPGSAWRRRNCSTA